MSDDYKAYREELQEQQSQQDYESIKAQMNKKSEFAVELDNLPKQDHIWVDRGLVLSCEGALHPTHRVFKRMR